MLAEAARRAGTKSRSSCSTCTGPASRQWRSSAWRRLEHEAGECCATERRELAARLAGSLERVRSAVAELGIPAVTERLEVAVQLAALVRYDRDAALDLRSRFSDLFTAAGCARKDDQVLRALVQKIVRPLPGEGGDAVIKRGPTPLLGELAAIDLEAACDALASLLAALDTGNLRAEAATLAARVLEAAAQRPAHASASAAAVGEHLESPSFDRLLRLCEAGRRSCERFEALLDDPPTSAGGAESDLPTTPAPDPPLLEEATALARRIESFIAEFRRPLRKMMDEAPAAQKTPGASPEQWIVTQLAEVLLRFLFLENRLEDRHGPALGAILAALHAGADITLAEIHEIRDRAPAFFVKVCHTMCRDSRAVLEARPSRPMLYQAALVCDHDRHTSFAEVLRPLLLDLADLAARIDGTLGPRESAEIERLRGLLPTLELAERE